MFCQEKENINRSSGEQQNDSNSKNKYINSNKHIKKSHIKMFFLKCHMKKDIYYIFKNERYYMNKVHKQFRKKESKREKIEKIEIIIYIYLI